MKIFVNEVPKCVKDKICVYDVRNIYKKNSDVIVINGFPINENVDINEGDRITLIKRGEIPDYEELESLMISRHTPDIHKKLKKGKVIILGLGGLGSNIAISLARMGVGKLILVDYDVVEPSNLNRQQYCISDIGKYKTEAMKENISKINPFIDVYCKNKYIDKSFLNEQCISGILEDEKFDIVVEAFDDPICKAMISSFMLKNKIHKYLIASSGMAGYKDSNSIQTKKIKDKFYICGDLVSEAKQGEGLMAPRVAICANHMANLAVQILVDNII